MKRSRFSEEQIIGILKEHQAGLSAAQLCRKHGVRARTLFARAIETPGGLRLSEPTFYKWRPKYGGLEVSEAKRLRALEEENAKLKKFLAESMMDGCHVAPLMGWMAPAPGIAMCHCGCRRKHPLREPSMQQLATIGVDLAKNVFQVHGISGDGEGVVRRKLRRSQVLTFFSRLEPCLVGMEACSGAHHWARELTALGHEVRLMPASYVKPYVKRGKTDKADAKAIAKR